MSQENEPLEPGAADRSGFINRWKRESGGRSSFIYIVVGVVAVTLTILLAIIYFSASERDRMSPPICTDITMSAAEDAVLEGEVDRLTIVYDEIPYTPTSERYGPVLAKLDYTDGTCSNLPQGVVNQDVVYTIAGVIAFYNENTDVQQVEVTYQRSDQLNEALFATTTPEPTETPTAEATTATTVIVPPVLPAASPAAGVASAAASPAATPHATP